MYVHVHIILSVERMPSYVDERSPQLTRSQINISIEYFHAPCTALLHGAKLLNLNSISTHTQLKLFNSLKNDYFKYCCEVKCMVLD